jgi:hypothetical protein
MPRRLCRLAAFALAGALAWPSPAAAEVEVDLALVIAVDVSFSMDTDEQNLQREGFIDAFRSAIVHDAIRRGAVGRIAVSYMEWAGASDQRTLLPWTILDGPDAANGFADQLSRKPTRRASRTSISGAIDYAVKMQEESGVSALRRVIDVSGDGPNNQGRSVLAARATRWPATSRSTACRSCSRMPVISTCRTWITTTATASSAGRAPFSCRPGTRRNSGTP